MSENKQPEPVNQQLLAALFNEALAWGATYGPVLNATQWHEQRQEMVKQYCNRAAEPAQPADGVVLDAVVLDGVLSTMSRAHQALDACGGHKLAAQLREARAALAAHKAQEGGAV